MKTCIDPTAATTIVAALLGAAATLLAIWPQLRRTKREAAANYIEAMASAAAGMADAFLQGQVPHNDGHAFIGLIDGYERHLKPYVEEEVRSDLEAFRGLARRAKDTDIHIAQQILLPGENFNVLAADLRRLAGDLRARAASIRVG